MSYWIAFYWVCAGIANFQLAAIEGRSPFIAFLVGGLVLPARLMAKLAV
jgi:hypothetical protein